MTACLRVLNLRIEKARGVDPRAFPCRLLSVRVYPLARALRLRFWLRRFRLDGLRLNGFRLNGFRLRGFRLRDVLLLLCRMLLGRALLRGLLLRRALLGGALGCRRLLGFTLRRSGVRRWVRYCTWRRMGHGRRSRVRDRTRRLMEYRPGCRMDRGMRGDRMCRDRMCGMRGDRMCRDRMCGMRCDRTYRDEATRRRRGLQDRCVREPLAYLSYRDALGFERNSLREGRVAGEPVTDEHGSERYARRGVRGECEARRSRRDRNPAAHDDDPFELSCTWRSPDA